MMLASCGHENTVAINQPLAARGTETGAKCMHVRDLEWHGSLDAAGFHPKQASSSSGLLVISSVAGAVVVVGGAIAFVVIRRMRPTGEARVD